MLVKTPIDISFAKGLDTKTDPKRVAIGNFKRLENTVFTKGGLLLKRYGYSLLASLPDATSTYLTTLNGNLTAVGTSISAYNASNSSWVSRGAIQPLSVGVLPLLRNNLNQTACDSAIAPNGLVCSAYLEFNGSTTANKYVIADSTTGQNIIAPVVVPVTSGAVSGGMRVFVLGNNFVIVFTNTIAGTAHLQFIAVSTSNPAVVTANADIASAYIAATTLSWDGFVANDTLYLAYNTTTGGQSVKVTTLTRSLAVTTATTFIGSIATAMSVTVDMTNASAPVVYASFYDSAGSTGYTLAVDQNLNVLMNPVQIIATGTVLNITSVAQDGYCKAFYEVSNAYAWAAGIPTNYVKSATVTLASASVTATSTIIRSVGLASKAFIVGGIIYFLSAYSSPFQPTYFLINGTSCTSAAPVIAAKLAYENGGGYLTTGLPGVTVDDTAAAMAYRFKDLIQAVNKNTNVPAGSQVAGVYSQTGINLATFDFGTENIDTAEIGGDLHLSGGFLWMYDGYLPVEHNFFLWPDTDQATPANTATWSAIGGSMAAQPDGATNASAYFYQFTYEWTDNVGNAYRSAPSIPIPVTTTGALSTGSVALSIATLRLTAKTANPVKIVIYRWSVAQQSSYQVTSITAPLMNSTTADTVTFTDTLADASILGNNLIYTTGGVVEDVNAPASNLMTLFDTRLWLVDAEDPNLLWFSKQVIEATPVEMSDLLTMFIPTTVGAATGEITSIYPMDDKLIISKGGNSFVYINGAGPDNTGANNQYSQPIFITSTVGCDNQKSMSVIPPGLIFQSNKGIWLLDRGLGTSYIGAPVEAFTTGATVLSAQTIPGTNQVRFVLDTGITLMYDYFYGQWGTFKGVPAVSSCVFQEMHTFLNADGAAYQELPGSYIDGSNPVLMAFTTGPIRLGELQSYQRAYFFYLLGEYISPHKLVVSVAYDYSDAPSHSVLISPTNFSTPYGSGSSQSPYGQGATYGGPSTLEEWRVFFDRQRCQAIAITVEEIYDSSYGVQAGAGLTLSGINVMCGFKKGYRPISSAHSAG